MNNTVSLFPIIKKTVLSALVFLFPLIFLPITQEYFITAKLYVMGFGSLLLITLSACELMLSKKFVWQKKQSDNIVLLFLSAVAISTLISSPNKIQALLNPTFGLVSLFSLMVLYFYLSRHIIPTAVMYVSSILLSVISILFFFQPFAKTALPSVLQFLKNPVFSPTGNLFDAVVFLGFICINAYAAIMKEKKSLALSVLPISSLIIGLIALSFLLFQLVKTSFFTSLTPVSQSWYSAVEVLKQPLTALFGIGVDNYSAMFTRVKDYLYNQSIFWQASSFAVSRSTFLHIITETGLLGGISFSLVLLSLYKAVTKHTHAANNLLIVGYLILMALLFPPSFMLFFLIFVTLGMVTSHENHNTPSHLDLSSLLPLYIGALILTFGFVIGSGYVLGRSYASEISFKKSLDGIARNNINDVYYNMRQAIILNPSIEKYRSNFADVNLLIANNIASKATPTEKNPKPPALTEQERQTISQAIQAAIEESKATVALNSQKAENWITLARIYRNILGVAQGADSWVISAYQRAIILDPQNPTYRIDLGGVLYGLKKYEEAFALFEQAVGIKPNLTNAHYNLAWSSFQKQDYQKAAAEMQNVISLLDPKNQNADYQKAQKELEEFKKMLPATENQATEEAVQQPTELAIPTPAQEIDPKIELPKTASPEAR